jgi:predicted signal transduction protein with EAL and GGDEF domain
MSAMEAPVAIGQDLVSVSISIGIATFPQDCDGPERLVQRADMAMHQAKAAGRNTHVFFDSSLDSALRERLVLEADLRKALDAGEIIPFYQPLVDFATNRVVGFEVLARWQHPKMGLLAPSQFVPIAEDAGMIGKLFGVILYRACRDAVLWQPSLLIAVNISPSQFNDPTLVPTIFDTLRRTGLEPKRLEIEITESSFVQNFDVARRIVGELKKKGVRLSLDDFGTGYSSLRHLHELSLDKIKIDRSFVENRSRGPEIETVISAMIGLGHNLGMLVTAEGIEYENDALWFHLRGCDQGQGYFYSRPMAADKIPDFLRTFEAPIPVEPRFVRRAVRG